MKKIFLIAGALFVSMNASAMISGYSMSVNEYQAIVTSPEVESKLGSAYRIESIVATPVKGGWGAVYKVTSTINTGERCTLEVAANYTTDPKKPMDLPVLNLFVGARTCK